MLGAKTTSSARVALLAALLALGSCRAPIHTTRTLAPKGGAPSADAVGVGEILTPDKLPLPTTCTPSGPELCFDATDNNCNGIIDEGCGVQTGPLQFSIAWDEGSDVNLEVTDPKGQASRAGERNEAGCIKDRDCGRTQSTCHGQNTENVYCTAERPPPGTYKVEIELHNPDEHQAPVKVRFGGRIGIKTFATDVVLTAPDHTKWWVTIPIE